MGYATVVLAAAVVAAVIGDLAWFAAGRKYGVVVLGLLCRVSLSRDTCVRRTADVFARRGVTMLLFARFIPGLSVVSAPLAGAYRVSLARFVAYAETGAVIWICCALAIGFVLADEIDVVIRNFRRIGLDAGGIALALTALYAGGSWVRRRQLLLRLRMARISVDELARQMRAGSAPAVIDARSSFEQDEDPFAIPGARILREDRPDREVAGMPRRDPVIIYCSCPNEISAAVVAKRMGKLGFTDVRPLLGGIAAWRAAGYPVAMIAPPGYARHSNGVIVLKELPP